MSTDATGKIRIMLPNNMHNMNNRLAITLTERFLESSEAISADIMIHSFAVNKALVLEHEIGHALGWHHVNIFGHIMHPEFVKIGHNTRYVKFSNYTKIIEKKNQAD